MKQNDMPMTRICVVMFMAVLSAAVSAGRTASSSGGMNDPAADEDRLLVMFWNLENMFDYRDSGTVESDAEFSSFGQRRWTKRRFYTKCNAVAKSILWIADREGRLPDVIGVAEVENAFVVRSIISATALKKYGYRMVHFDSPDRRGIDVALLYREDVFEKLSARPCHIYVNCGRLSAEQGGGSGKAGSQPEQEKPVHDDTECVTRQAELMRTRDILSVSLRHRADGSTYHFLVNHHPSKYGGAKASEGRRRIAMQRLRELCDSLYAAGGDVSGGAGAACDRVSGTMPRSGIGENRDVRIIAMGDFNDTPSRGPFDVLCGGDRQSETGVRNRSGADRCGIVPGRNAMVNLGNALEAEGEGTIRYGGKWELIDMFIVSQSLAGKSSGLDGVERSRSRMEVARIPFLMTRDNTHVGDRPLRTYSGPRYTGGVSDHCPVILTIAPLADDF